MMYYIDLINTWKAANRKIAELQEFVKQFQNTLIADEISRDALVEEIRHKVAELNEAYPKTKKLELEDAGGFVYATSGFSVSDGGYYYAFTFHITSVRRTYRFSEPAPAGEEKAQSLPAAEPLNPSGSNEPTTNPRRTYNDDINMMKGGTE